MTSDEREPLILPYPIRCQHRGEDGILFQAKTQLTMDELMLYAAVCEYGEMRVRELGYDPGLTVVAEYIEHVLATWPVPLNEWNREVIARLQCADRQQLITRITSYFEEIDQIQALARPAEGSA
jgi:hypothetical protein